MDHQKVRSMQKTLSNILGDCCPSWGLDQKGQMQNQTKMESFNVGQNGDNHCRLIKENEPILNTNYSSSQKSAEHTSQSPKANSVWALSELPCPLQICIVWFLALLLFKWGQ